MSIYQSATFLVWILIACVFIQPSPKISPKTLDHNNTDTPTNLIQRK